VLSPLALAVLLGYSVTKRLTDHTHAVLGLALGLAPVLLGGAVLLWVAGFDILYSCQDVEVDRADPRLHSLPKRLGVGRALVLARRLHAGALLGFAAFAFAARPELGTLFLAAVAGAGGLMAWQHQLVRPGDLSRVNQAFFTANGIVSLGMLAAAALDLSV
jgi:4-hydroxybenzoate polyprenyltransferase